MTLKVSKSGVPKVVAKVSIVIGGVLKEVAQMSIMKTVGSTRGLRVFYQKPGPPPPPPPPPAPPPPPPPPPAALTVEVTPSSMWKGLHGTGTVTTDDFATASASGGTEPYTYHWSLISWTHSPPPTALSPDSNSTNFSQTSMGTEDNADATFKCTVFDSLGNIGSATVDINFFTYTTTGGGGGGGPLP